MLLQGNINAFRVQLHWVCKLIALLFERKVNKAVARGHKKMLHRRVYSLSVQHFFYSIYW